MAAPRPQKLNRYALKKTQLSGCKLKINAFYQIFSHKIELDVLKSSQSFPVSPLRGGLGQKIE